MASRRTPPSWAIWAGAWTRPIRKVGGGGLELGVPPPLPYATPPTGTSSEKFLILSSLVGRLGFEPRTDGLKVRCSGQAELPAHAVPRLTWR